jgi:hypothetical protein
MFALLHSQQHRGEALAPYGLWWFEDICDPLDFDNLAAVASRYTGPIAAHGRRSGLWLPRTQIRAYRWCSPPGIGCAIMSPNRSPGTLAGTDGSRQPVEAELTTARNLGSRLARVASRLKDLRVSRAAALRCVRRAWVSSTITSRPHPWIARRSSTFFAMPSSVAIRRI